MRIPVRTRRIPVAGAASSDPRLDAGPSSLQSYYAARAAEYDAVYRKPERQPDLRQIERWLPSLLRDRRILEIACGTGYWTRFLEPVASSIVAIDSAEETLHIARQRVAPDKVSFAIGDAYAPAPPGRSFDAAFPGFWLSHVPRSGCSNSSARSTRRSSPERRWSSWTIVSSREARRRSPSATHRATLINGAA